MVYKWRNIKGQVAHHSRGTWGLEGDNGLGATNLMSKSVYPTMTAVIWRKQTAFSCTSTVRQESSDRPKQYGDSAHLTDPSIRVRGTRWAALGVKAEGPLESSRLLNGQVDHCIGYVTVKFHHVVTDVTFLDCAGWGFNFLTIRFSQIISIRFGQKCKPHLVWMSGQDCNQFDLASRLDYSKEEGIVEAPSPYLSV